MDPNHKSAKKCKKKTLQKSAKSTTIAKKNCQKGIFVSVLLTGNKSSPEADNFNYGRLFTPEFTRCYKISRMSHK